MNWRQQLGASWTQLRHSWKLDNPWRIAAGVAIAFVLMAAIAFGPVVRSVAISRARERGVELEIGSVRPGWFAVELHDTTVQLTGAPAIRAKLDALVVSVTPWLSLSEIELHGGEVLLTGAVATVVEQTRQWRASRRGGTQTSGGGRSGLTLRGDGVTVRWSDAEPGAAEQIITGIHFERGEVQRVGFQSAKLQLSAGALQVVQAEAELVDTPDGAALSSATVAQIIGRITMPDDAPGASDDDAVRDEAEDTEAELPAASAGAASAQPARSGRFAALAGVPWADRKAQLSRLRALLARAFADGASVTFQQVQLELARGTSVLNVGPAPFRLGRQGDLISASFTPPAQEDGNQLTVQGRLPLTEAPVELSFEGGPISLATLGVHEGDFGLLGVAQSELTLATRVTLSPQGLLDLAASGRIERLSLQHPALAPEPVQDMDLGWRGQVRLDFERHRLEIKDAGVSVEGVRAELGGSLEANGRDLHVAFKLRVPNTPCQVLLEAAPPALLPQLQGLRMGGTLGLDARVDFDTAAPKDSQVEWNLHNRCSVQEIPEDVDPQRFRQPFAHLVLDAKGEPAELTTGPGTPAWVPLAEISPYIETALVVCEDSRFFSHKGFDDKAIRDSIGDNLRAGRFVRGASTLSMQLAKNLYLGREKTLSRKLQEAVFTLLLEERLSKQDILELYLNVVEFGPGVYGIRNAAMYYFNSHPGELSLGQALYFGSILPSPKAKHFQADGSLKRRWAEHLQALMRIAHKIKRIGDEELAAGLAEQLRFGQAQVAPDLEFQMNNLP